ncbi:MAG: agmatine deiminase family protein [bacterium]|nr:agmatine deiminase family protein [bacterium]
MTTPRQEGYYMPAEWHPHSACWMAWAASRETFGKAPLAPEEAYREAKKCYGQVAQAISRYEPVFMLTNKPDFEETRALCGPKVTIIEAQIDDGWFRDSGPTFVINESGDIAGVNWVFNGWGGRYPHGQDDEAAGKLLSRLGIKQFESPLVLEGGGIHVDGQGTLLVTESCQLNKNRNPDLSKAQVEEYLREYLNVDKIIWLNGNREQSETDGHVDGLACFIRPGVVLAAVGSDANHPDFDALQENLEILKRSKDAKGRPIRVVEISEPYDYLNNGTLLKGIYANFYMANNAIILPAFDFPEYDQAARNIFKREFPNCEIVQLPTRILLFGGGNIHCITQQQPVAGIEDLMI